jgi:hypothetical protein
MARLLYVEASPAKSASHHRRGQHILTAFFSLFICTGSFEFIHIFSVVIAALKDLLGCDRRTQSRSKKKVNVLVNRI